MAGVGAHDRARQLAVRVALLAPLAVRLGLAFQAGPQSGARNLAHPATLTSRPVAVPLSAEAPRAAGYGAESAPGALTLACSFVALLGAGLARAGAKRRRSGPTARRANLVASSPDQAIPWWDRLSKPRTEEGIGIFAEKLNMTTIFDESQAAKAVGATILVVKRGGNIVTDLKWPEKHGYYAVQVGYDRYVPEEWELGRLNKRLATLAAKDLPPLKKIKEFRMRPQDWQKYEIGQKLWPSDLFKEGDLIDIHGRTKGKGFMGAIRRWGHKRGPMSHGSKHHRRYGSIGSGSSTPSRVFPGKKMAAWMGDRNSTQQSSKILKIIDRIDEDNMPETIIVVQGSVPGYTAHWETGGSYVYLHKKKNKSDGRFKRDPVWLWYTKKGEDVDPYTPIPGMAWTWKTFWGRDIRWITQEVKKYWPDGFPGYDHSLDPFYDGCDPHLAIKAPEW